MSWEVTSFKYLRKSRYLVVKDEDNEKTELKIRWNEISLFSDFGLAIYPGKKIDLKLIEDMIKAYHFMQMNKEVKSLEAICLDKIYYFNLNQKCLPKIIQEKCYLYWIYNIQWWKKNFKLSKVLIYHLEKYLQ